MTCFYYLTRTPDELKEMLATETLKIGHHPFFTSDSVKMTEVVRQDIKRAPGEAQGGAPRRPKSTSSRA